MKILAIESSCDETAAAVVEDGRTVLSSIIASQVDAHIVYGGVVPEIASRMHAEAISNVVKQALEKAKCTMNDIEAIAVTYAPGLIGALLIGVNFAKGLSFSEQHLDEDEFLEILRIPFEELLEKVISGEIKDAKTQVAVMKARMRNLV